ncbi:MAG: PD40 domain-containing protein [Gemmatimonadetes bacterium]|nr:PD40 domain-containing protein [Gemmatimonadota bacterium]
MVEIVDVRSGVSLASSTSSFGGTGFDLAWSPDGQYMVLIEDRAFSIRETDTLREIRLVNSEHPASAAFSPDGRLLALGSWSDGIVTSLASVLASPDARG